MKKEKKIKMLIGFCSGIFFLSGLIYYNYLCSSVYNDFCIVVSYNDTILKPIFIMSISLFITTLFTFFISDKIFKKWLIFTVIYFAITAFLIHISPTTMKGPLVGPTKGLVSMNLSWIFVVISLIMFIWLSLKEKK